ncbi:MAG TPA: PAS domain-containing sensor histidine kinase, partial [Vulgatibacter sp.]|nr:PAS domain-containing sensor histidine kinase [Vulgatibacter sp.]
SAAIQGWNARREKERLLERQRAFTEAAWRRAAEWEAVLASIVDGVWVVDTDMQVTFANEGARRIFDARRIEDLLRPWSEYAIFADILDASENPVDLEEMPPMRALQGHATSDVGTQIVLRSKGERKFLGLSAAPIRDPAGKIVGAVAVATDRTQQVEFGRLKDQFIRVAAHELKTPVAIMKGYAQLALRVGDETSPAQLERLRAIDRGSDRIDRIIQDLLSVSQVYAEGFSLQIRPADLRELTVAAIGSLSKETPDRDIRLEAPDPAPVQVDVDRIEYVLRSLLDNAIRYSPAGGPIEVTIEVEPKQEAARAGGRGTVTVSVADQGIGIAPSKQAQVFEPFFRVHTDTPYDYGGMGVGLFTSREIVRQHGGSIWFESTEGEGSTFYFRLPLGDGDDRAQGVDRG